MNWMLVVFATTIADNPVAILQTPIATEALCRAAAKEIEKALDDPDQGGLIKNRAICFQVSN